MSTEKQTPWEKSAKKFQAVYRERYSKETPLDRFETWIKEACESHAAELKAELTEARAAVATMPGAWVCDKCGFILQNSKLHVADGSVSANTADECKGCPNDGGPMRALTWREANENIYERCLSEIKTATDLKADNERLDQEVQVEIGFKLQAREDCERLAAQVALLRSLAKRVLDTCEGTGFPKPWQGDSPLGQLEAALSATPAPAAEFRALLDAAQKFFEVAQRPTILAEAMQLYDERSKLLIALLAEGRRKYTKG